MKIRTKVLIGLLLSFSVLFSGIGYAALSDEMNITGTLQASEPEALYITEIKNVLGSVSEPLYEIASYTVVRSSITLGSNSSDTVTMEITVKNNTSEPYGFNAIRYTYGDQTFSNSGIEIKTDMVRKIEDPNAEDGYSGTKIEPGDTHTFTATFKYKDNVLSAPELISLINYEFLPWDDIIADSAPDAGVAGDALDQFEDILNNVDDPNSHQKLLDQMAKHEEADRYSPDYIANFDSANADDKAVIEELFGTDSLKVVIDGVETEVRLIIKQKEVSSTSDGMEFVVFITTHSLQRNDAIVEGSLFNRKYYASPIYAAVFSVSDDGVWGSMGDMYIGRGEINQYNGWPGSGSFDTETWRSTQDYDGAPSGSTIENIINNIP